VEASSARKEGGEEHQCDMWRLAGMRWRWGGGLERWAARRHAGGAEQRSWPEVEENGLLCNF